MHAHIGNMADCLDIEVCQLKNGYSSPTSMGTPPFSLIVIKLIISFAREKTNLISIAENLLNKENSRYTVVFSILPFGNHLKKIGSNFNQEFIHREYNFSIVIVGNFKAIKKKIHFETTNITRKNS